MFYGLFSLPWWGYILVFLVYAQFTILGVTIYLHRAQAHRALSVHPVLGFIFRAWLWLTTGMSTKEWASIHRKHHAKCETAEDPHSPQIFGLSTVLWRGAELYRREALNAETLERYGYGTPNDWFERNVFIRHCTKGYWMMLVINAVTLGVPGVAIWALQMMTIPFCGAGVINGIGHYWGYRNYECPDEARNICPLAIFVGGEELHNNHHTYPTSAKFSVKWWEVDIGWGWIQLLSLFRLVKVKRVVPQPEILVDKSHIEAEALRAIVTNKIQIMTEYTKTVLLPVFNQSYDLKKESETFDRTIWRKIKTLLARETTLIDDSAKEGIRSFLENDPKTKTAYQLREKLHDIWGKTTASQKELLELLSEWCVEAEASGIKALNDFVVYLKGYRLKAL